MNTALLMVGGFVILLMLWAAACQLNDRRRRSCRARPPLHRLTDLSDDSVDPDWPETRKTMPGSDRDGADTEGDS